MSKRCLCGGVFSSGGSLWHFARLAAHVCVCANVHTCIHACRAFVCVKCASVGGGGWGEEGRGGGGWGMFRWGSVDNFATEGTVCKASHSDNPQCCVPECWRANIFSTKRCVNRANIFSTRFVVFWKDYLFFSFKGKTHLHQFCDSVQLKPDCERPQKCHRWLRALAWSDSFR